MQHEKWNMNYLFLLMKSPAMKFVPVLQVKEHKFSGFELAVFHKIMPLLGTSKI